MHNDVSHTLDRGPIHIMDRSRAQLLGEFADQLADLQNAESNGVLAHGIGKKTSKESPVA